MQSGQTVLHNESELKSYLETAIVILAERAGHSRAGATPDILREAPPDTPDLVAKAEAAQPKIVQSSTAQTLTHEEGDEEDEGGQQDVLHEHGLTGPQPPELPAVFKRWTEVDLPYALTETNSLPILHGPSELVPIPGFREALIVTTDDFVTIPLVVDIWITHCASNVQLYRYTQPRNFACGLVVWSILHHYFPRDAQLSAFHAPQTRREYAEVWSQVDLILQKHGLTRVPVEVISAVMAHRQVGQAILLMTLYESLTNLKLPHPIPVLRDHCRRGRSGSHCNKRHYLQETKSNVARRPASFGQLLRKMFTTNQEMAFCRAHRRLQPPRVNRHFESRVDFGSGRDAELIKLERLVLRPAGERCYLFHADRQELIKKHREREKSSASGTPVLVLLQPPFFTADPLTKQPRVRVG
ncbi:hypothetical protein BV898_18124 [Hypsibius exemplaris]|uniref:Uncharacterized protein n=1 Tax=Hypsibius exemplaris TaxID=2072580 RepID=A0A9X6NGS9_HYPEX|nr:hypothetical protein BV898_18124 [Hypsibius exemplaris]